MGDGASLRLGSGFSRAAATWKIIICPRRFSHHRRLLRARGGCGVACYGGRCVHNRFGAKNFFPRRRSAVGRPASGSFKQSDALFGLAPYRMALPQSPFFVRAAFPLARCGRGLIYQAQNGCGCAVADDGSQRDAACRGMGDGDAGNAAGAINCAPTVRSWRNRRFFVRSAFPCARCR